METAPSTGAVFGLIYRKLNYPKLT